MFPQGMADHPRQRDPDVAVDEVLLSRAGRRVVVAAGPLDARAIALGGGIVQGEEPALVRLKAVAHSAEQQRREQIDAAAADGAEQGVGAAELVADAAGPEPGSGGALAACEQETEQQRFDKFSVALVEEGS